MLTLTKASDGRYNIAIFKDNDPKTWKSSPDNQNYRECPVYVNQLLEKAVLVDFSGAV